MPRNAISAQVTAAQQQQQQEQPRQLPRATTQIKKRKLPYKYYKKEGNLNKKGSK